MKTTTNYIGKTVKITASPNKQLLGKTGVVIDETKNMLKLSIAGEQKSVIKNQTTIKVFK